MSVILTDMEMPRGCYTCKLKSICEYGIANEWLFEKRADDCPLREERKTGKWIVQPSPFYANTTIYICPFCKSQYERNSWEIPKFCQDCGMKSIGIDETHKYAGFGKIYEDYPNKS